MTTGCWRGKATEPLLATELRGLTFVQTVPTPALGIGYHCAKLPSVKSKEKHKNAASAADNIIMAFRGVYWQQVCTIKNP